MTFFCLLLALTTPGTVHSLAGRWDLTVTTSEGTFPSWLEIEKKEEAPQVRVVGRLASAHLAKDVKLEGSHLSFTSSEWLEKTVHVKWDISLVNGKLVGTQKRDDGVEGRLVGVRAPVLLHKAPVHWTDPEPLFNGKDLTGWSPDVPAKNQWVVQNGELINEKPGANLRSNRRLNDFKLHIEYNCPTEGNSGIYLRGRYELQVEYMEQVRNNRLRGIGAVYGFLAPAVDMPRVPGQWEKFDVTLVGRMVTVARNGVITINNQEIPGITGGALDSHEGSPGTIYIQGDHTGGIKYRNITIQVPAP